MAGFEKLPPLSLSQNDAHETHHSVFLRLRHLLQRYDLKYFIQFYRFKAWLIKYYPTIFVIQINKSFYISTRCFVHCINILICLKFEGFPFQHFFVERHSDRVFLTHAAATSEWDFELTWFDGK